MEQDNFAGYYFKIGDCNFTSPSPLRDKYKFAPNLILVADATSVASGKLSIKVLPHTRKKIWVEFPPLTPSQFRVYWKALKGSESGPGMYLSVEAFDESTNAYITDTYYHNDLIYRPITLQGQRMIILEPFELIGH